MIGGETHEGSSPHTRGAPAEALSDVLDYRIIPAYAGSTALAAGGDDGFRDHPRIRGEHVLVVAGFDAYEGSSPHTRGALAGELVGRGAAGIIPAYAGSTCTGLSSIKQDEDHPRIRGEHPFTMLPLQPVIGSSPHTRGAQGGPDLVAGAGRIIPAYAGSTARRSPGAHAAGDHPRIRGEHSYL